MKQVKAFILCSFIAMVCMFLVSSTGISGSTLQVTRQPATKTTSPAPDPTPAQVQTPTIQKGQVPKQVVKTYSMAIDNISLTSQCQVQYRLRNTGDDLSADQHKNSYVRVMHNAPISLAVFDQAGRLRIKGQKITSMYNKPLKQDTNIIITVTLFNGKKITKNKFLKLKCAAPKVNIPAQRTETPNIIPTAPPEMNIPSTPVAKTNKTPGLPSEDETNIIPSLPSEDETNIIPSLPSGGETNTIPVAARQEAIKPTTPVPPGNLEKALQPTTQVPTVKQLPKQAVINYAMAIENLSLTSQCHVTFTVKNTGANLSVDQYKNSYLKVGNNPPVSLKAVDHTGNLRTNGQILIYFDNVPIKKDTNLTVSLTLFNNKKTIAQRLLEPTCTPKITFQKAPQPITTKSGDSPIGKKVVAVPKQYIQMPKTILQVERMGGDLETWDSWAGTDTSVQKMDFRWKTEFESLLMAHWEVALNPNFPYVIAKGPVKPIPPKGTYGKFSIDLGTFSGTYTKPVTFYIRVRPMKLGGIKVMASGSDTPSDQSSTTPSTPPYSSYDEGLEPSTAVRISLVEAGSGPVTEFNLPERHLQVVFTKVKMVDDSDDLSGGDMSFKFTVNGQSEWKDFSDDRLDTDETHNLGNVTITVTDPPNITPISIYGCDDDDTPGKFTSTGNHCGGDPDTASVSYDIRTYKNKERWNIPQTPFNLYASGGSLKFRVEGHYSLYCSPCPQGVEGPLILEVLPPPGEDK